MAPKHIPRQERESQIIEGAMKCFLKQGYRRTTIDDIAAACQLSKGSIYWYFETKLTILISVISSVTKQMEKNVTQLIHSEKSTLHVLKKILRLLSEFQVKHNNIVQLLIESWFLKEEEEALKQFWQTMVLKIHATLVSILNQGIEQGIFRAISSQSLAWVILAAFDGLGIYSDFVKSMDIIETMETFLDNILEGIIKRSHHVENNAQ